MLPCVAAAQGLHLHMACHALSRHAIIGDLALMEPAFQQAKHDSCAFSAPLVVAGAAGVM